MVTSYRTRSITVRQTLVSGQTLTSSQYGPDVSSTWPIGKYFRSSLNTLLLLIINFQYN